MCKKMVYLTFVALAIAATASLCKATVAPITSVMTDNLPGNPPYHLRSITVGNYTVDVSWLSTGTSTTTLAASGTLLPGLDDLEIGVEYIAAEPIDQYTVYLFGGKLWSDVNGDNPDFFIFILSPLYTTHSHS